VSVCIVAYQGVEKYEGNVADSDEEIDLFEVDGNSGCPEFLDGLDIDDIYSYSSGIWFGFGEGQVLNETWRSWPDSWLTTRRCPAQTRSVH
jgi:hypothetical protein